MQMYVSRELVQLKKKRASQNFFGKNQKVVYLKRKILKNVLLKFFLDPVQNRAAWGRVSRGPTVAKVFCDLQQNTVSFVSINQMQFYVMPSPSASSKFVLSVLKLLGTLKWGNSYSKI